MSTSVAIVGTGYVGLTTGACLAHLGHRVICADIDPARVATLQAGSVPFYEPGLAELVAEGVAARRLSFVLGGAAAVSEADLVFLCVPTPQADDGSVDLSFVEEAARSIATSLRPSAVVVNKSTVPVGSAAVVDRIIARDDVSVVSNPEFLREGSAVSDFLHPDRVVVGSESRAAAERVAALYESIDAPVLLTDPASAETIKYAANAFLATKISFVNAIAAVCEAVGADIADVVKGLGSDKRIGSDFLRPGPG
ncbi:MAG: UDP-glucose 6-dehydrogenase, partial [Actinomycetota bacterium]